MRIAILYICTGKYEIFWDRFYDTSQKHFYAGHLKHYFVFTDSERIIRQRDSNISVYYQAKSGWPYDTLLRYNWFCTIQDLLREYDVCYYVNANSEFLRDVTEEEIPFPSTEYPLVLSIHPKYYDDDLGVTFNPERNPDSLAYVPEGTKCRSHCGAFWGAKSDAFIEMSCILRDRTADDLSRGIIAVWHDQSHLIKYATEVPHYNIENGLVSYEEYADFDKCLLVFTAKSKFGGNDNLREVSTRVKLQHLPKKVYKALLDVAAVVHLDGVLRGVVKIAKGKR